MKVAMPLAKNALALLGLTAAVSAIDESIQKKIHGSGVIIINYYYKLLSYISYYYKLLLL